MQEPRFRGTKHKSRGIGLWNNNVSHVAAIKHTKYLSAQESHHNTRTDVTYTYPAELGGQLLLPQDKCSVRVTVTFVHWDFWFCLSLTLINYYAPHGYWMWFGGTETSSPDLTYETHTTNLPPAPSDRSFKSNETFLRFHWQILKLRRQWKRSGESRLMWKLDREVSEP